MPMNMLLVGGTTMRVAWGITTRKNVWGRLMPTDMAACRCPCATAWIPLRKISPSQHEYCNVSARTPAWMAVIENPKWMATP